MRKANTVLAAFFAATLALTVSAESSAQGPANGYTYADLADLALPAPVAAHVRIRSASRLKPAEAATVPAGKTRFYVEADVVSLIRGAQGLPARVAYLADLPNDARGKPAKLARKSEQIILAAPVPGRPGELQLVAPDAQLAWDAAQAEQLRSLLREAAQRNAPPRITGIGKAFHVPGSLPGESESQIFLQTADGAPVSLTVLRRPGEAPRWAVALSEITDDTAAAPARDSLLWYRLACTLPARLPAASLSGTDAGQQAAIADDYRLILESLGSCARSRARG